MFSHIIFSLVFLFNSQDNVNLSQHLESLPEYNYRSVSLANYSQITAKDFTTEELAIIAPNVGYEKILGSNQISGVTGIIRATIMAEAPMEEGQAKPTKKNTFGRLIYIFGDSLSEQYNFICRKKESLVYKKRKIHFASNDRRKKLYCFLYDDTLIIESSSLEILKKSILTIDGEETGITATEQFTHIKNTFNDQDGFSIDLFNYHQINHYRDNKAALRTFSRKPLYKATSYDYSSEGMLMEEIIVYLDEDYVPESTKIDYSRVNWGTAPKSVKNQVKAYGKDWHEKKDGNTLFRTKLIPYELLVKGKKARADIKKWKEERQKEKDEKDKK